MKYKKALLTVGAISVLGTAGSFGTFAAFTDAVDAPTQTLSSGDIDVTGTFALPTVDKMVIGASRVIASAIRPHRCSSAQDWRTYDRATDH